MRKVKHIGIFILMLVCMEAAGQKFSLSTNAVGYIDFCTFKARMRFPGIGALLPGPDTIRSHSARQEI